jgi:tetratricopeptide (TPR) repeat protein
MSEHPSREILEGFLRSSLPPAQFKSMVVHLLAGCDQCRDGLADLAAVMFKPDAAPEPVLSVEQEAAYDGAISAALSCALDRDRTLEREREEAERRIAAVLHSSSAVDDAALEGPVTWGFCEILLEKSRELRHTDRPGMLRLAVLAQRAADRLDSQAHGAEQRFDLQARAWAELANAYRLADDLAEAEAAMARALELRTQGSGDPLLYARIADLRASLLSDQRRFNEAFHMLDAAQAIYHRYGDSHEEGRTLITRGLYTGYAGDPEQGLQLLTQGLSMLDRERDEKLVFHTLHNMLLLRVELGDFEAASRQLRRMLPLYAANATWIDQVKLRRIEGQIAAGLGRLDEAEELFLQTKRDLDEAGLGYEASLVTLNLAEVRLQRGETAGVRELVGEMVGAFRSLGVEREAMAAVLLLWGALERDQLTLDVLRRAGGVLRRRARNEPAGRAGLDSF